MVKELLSEKSQLLFLLLIIFIYRGCIPIYDLGDYWDKGIIDPQLEGHWKEPGDKLRSGDTYLSFIKSGDHYIHNIISADGPDGFPDKKTYIKTLILGKHKFLMFAKMHALGIDSISNNDPNSSLKKSEAAKKQRNNTIPGGLQRYTIENDILTLYTLNYKILQHAIKNNQVRGKIESDDPNIDSSISLPCLSKLDKHTIEFIIDISNQPKLWDRVVKHKRIENIEEALQESRTYPSTPETPKNTEVIVDLPDFKYMAEDKTDILLRQLQAMPDWRVYKRNDGSFVCKHKQRQRGLFRFDESPFGKVDPFVKEWLISVLSPLEGKAHIRLLKTPTSIESYIAVGQKGLWYEFRDINMNEDRYLTRERIQWLAKFTQIIRRNEKEINDKGYTTQLLSYPNIKKGKPHFKIDTLSDGKYRVWFWVNPQEQGYVYLKVLNTENNEIVSGHGPTNSSGMKETPLYEKCIGYSNDPNTLFLFETTEEIYRIQNSKPFLARFELWFHPDNDKREYILLEGTHEIRRIKYGRR